MTAVRVFVVMLIVVMVQLVVAPVLTVGGVRLEVTLLLAVVLGLSGGPDNGALVAFGVGVFVDLLIGGPLGLTGLVYALVAYGVGTIQSAVVHGVWWIPVLVAGAASAAGLLVFVGLSELFGEHHISADVPRIVAVVAVVNAVLAPGLVRMMGWAWVTPDDSVGLVA